MVEVTPAFTERQYKDWKKKVKRHDRNNMLHFKSLENKTLQYSMQNCQYVLKIDGPRKIWNDGQSRNDEWERQH